MMRRLMIGGDRLPVVALVSLMSCWICLATACGTDDAKSGASDTGGSGQSDATGGSGDAGSESGGNGGAAATGVGGGPSDDECRVFMAPDGTDSESCGSADDPCATLAVAYDRLCPVPPEGTENGTECEGPAPRTLCVRPGTYPMTERFELRKTRMGTESNPVVIQAAPTATTKPVFDFSSQPRVSACGAQSDSTGGELTGITMNADWTVLKNVVVTDANDNCVKVQGANNLVEGVVVHGCDDAGIQISAGSGYQGSGTNNAIVNCDSYQNHDPQCLGMNADGFALKSGTGAGNVFRGCRAWDNTDDGWDLGGWTDPVRVENCWAMSQCASTADERSDCNGFLLGGNDWSTQHVLVDLIAVGNRGGASGCGFTPDTNPASMTCDGTCAAWDNDSDVVAIGGVSTAQIGSVTAEQLINAERGPDGSLPDISSL